MLELCPNMWVQLALWLLSVMPKESMGDVIKDTLTLLEGVRVRTANAHPSCVCVCACVRLCACVRA